MYHSITFNQGYDSEERPINERNTWDSWHLIPASRPLVNPAPAKTTFVEIPGADGTLDLTTAMTGRPMYGDRTGSWSFYVENGFKDWSNLYSEIMNYLQGKKYQARLEDDYGYYYEGRFWVNEWRSDPARSMITISYEVGPYKMYEGAESGKWLWDPFYFGDHDVPSDRGDEIKNYKNLIATAAQPLTVTVTGGRMDTIPSITVTRMSSAYNPRVTMTFKGITYSLSNDVPNIIDDVVVTSGDNVFTFTVAPLSGIDARNVKVEVSIIVVGGLL